MARWKLILQALSYRGQCLFLIVIPQRNADAWLQWACSHDNDLITYYLGDSSYRGIQSKRTWDFESQPNSWLCQLLITFIYLWNCIYCHNLWHLAFLRWNAFPASIHKVRHHLLCSPKPIKHALGGGASYICVPYAAAHNPQVCFIRLLILPNTHKASVCPIL